MPLDPSLLTLFRSLLFARALGFSLVLVRFRWHTARLVRSPTSVILGVTPRSLLLESVSRQSRRLTSSEPQRDRAAGTLRRRFEIHHGSAEGPQTLPQIPCCARRPSLRYGACLRRSSIADQQIQISARRSRLHPRARGDVDATVARFVCGSRRVYVARRAIRSPRTLRPSEREPTREPLRAFVRNQRVFAARPLRVSTRGLHGIHAE